MKLYLLLLLFSFNAFAQMDLFDLPEEEIDPPTEDILIKKPEKFLRNESMIYDLNTDLGIKDQRRYTGNDFNRFSVAGHVNASYEHPQNLYGIEATYMHRTKRYNRVWWGGQFFNHFGRFGTVSDNATVGNEAKTHRPSNAKNTIMGVGLGLSYRFKLLLDFFPTEDVFENIDVFVNYLSFKENYVDETYKGYGLTAAYGIHKRSSTNFFYGGKIAYNAASVVRPGEGHESKSDRTLPLGWLSMAFEVGFFY
ncbi:MAG: hypothetical protein ACJ76H_09740 [Bacteriovoracaceae bacterium]